MVIIYYMSENMNQFMNNENMSLLWEVLLDELQIANHDTNMKTNLKFVFDSNIKLFTNSMKYNNTINLVNMNKQFLSQVFIAVNSLFPKEQRPQQQIKKIKISDNEIEEPYNVEDIKHARQSDFEKQLNQKRNEFEESITLKKPKDIDFAYKQTDEKITEMDNLIKETMKQRNFEINTIQNAYALDNKTTEWLNVKNDSSFKQRNIDTKSVTWNDNINLDITELSELSSPNIFNKLKKIEQKVETSPVETSSVETTPVETSPTVETSSVETTPVETIQEELHKLHVKIDSLHEMLKEILINQQQTNKSNGN